MTFFDFIQETWLWVEALSHHQRVEEAAEAAMNLMRGIRDTVIAWWRCARILTIGTLSTVSLLLFAGFIAGLYWEEGATVNAVTGIIAAALLFILSVWWIPLAAVIGVASEIAHGNFRAALTGGGVSGAERWMRIVRGILLWQLIMSFYLTIVPYRNAPTSVPLIALCVLLAALMSSVWKTGDWYKKLIRGAVYFVLATSTLFCFFPSTAAAVRNTIKQADTDMARRIRQDGIVWGAVKQVWSIGFGKSEAEASGSAMTVKANVLPAGNYTQFLEGGAMTDYIQPTGAYDIESPDMEFDLITIQGRVVASLDKANWPANGEPFRIVAIKKQRLTIKVS